MATTEVDRFAAFFGMLGHELEDFQRMIVEEVFSERRETLALVPRGSGKSTLLAALALWALLRKPDAQIVCAAASRDQAAVLFDLARGFARHSEIAPLVETTRREIRTAGGWLRVIAADGPKQHGLIVDMAIVDELHAHTNRGLYDALRTTMLKRTGARMITISTSGATIDTPLGELRDRCLKLPHVTVDGAFTRAEGPHLAMLQWALPAGSEISDIGAVLDCNPASWITKAGLLEQRAAVHPLTFARYHANVWTGGESPWVMAEEWDACGAPPVIDEGAEVVIGIDASIKHDTTSVVVVRRDADDVYHALFRTWTPTGGREVSLSEVEAFVRDLASHFVARSVVYDPMFFFHAAQRLEDEGVAMIEWAHARMVGATSTLHEVVTHGRLRHGGDELAREHALAAEVRERERGLTISKRATRAPIDCLVSLAMAVDIAASMKPKRRSAYDDPDYSLVVA